MYLNIISHEIALFFPQDYATTAEQDMSRLAKEVKSKQNARVTAEKKLEGTEQALVNLSQENAALQSKREETQKKLQATETELLTLKQMITQMLIAIVGKSNACFLLLTRLFCFLQLLLY